MRSNLLKISIGPKDSIKTALNKLALHKSAQTPIPGGIILIADKDEKLMGIVTDGDIRRALSKGVSLESPISKIMNITPFLIEGPKTNTEIVSLAADKIRKENWHKDRLNKIIIVDKEKRVIDLVSFYDVWQRSDVRFRQIGILGLGYVGLTLALTLADLGFKAMGFDINAEVRKSLRSGKPHFFENGLARMLKDNLNKNFKVVDNFEREDNCDVYFIAVGTPLDKNNKPDLKYLADASNRVGKNLKSGDLVILRSTVPIGTTRNFVVPLLEKKSGLKAGKDFFVAFAPERTIEGKALEELRSLPQVIGGVDRVSADLAATIFSHMTHSTVLVDSLEEAEVVKLVNNTYRDVTFSFANELSLVCHRFGIDTHRVIEAANRGYERSNVPLPSPGVGGACLEKDPFIFVESAKTKNYEPLLTKHSRRVSELMIDFVANEVSEFIRKQKSVIRDPKILILGFAFKGRPATSDTRGSTTIKLVNILKKEFRNIHVYDPVVKRSDILAHKVKHVTDIGAGFDKAHAVIVMNNNQAFEDLDIRSMLKFTAKPTFLFDTWGLYNKEEIKKVRGVEYKRL